MWSARHFLHFDVLSVKSVGGRWGRWCTGWGVLKYFQDSSSGRRIFWLLVLTPTYTLYWPHSSFFIVLLVLTCSITTTHYSLCYTVVLWLPVRVVQLCFPTIWYATCLQPSIYSMYYLAQWVYPLGLFFWLSVRVSIPLHRSKIFQNRKRPLFSQRDTMAILL